MYLLFLDINIADTRRVTQFHRRFKNFLYILTRSLKSVLALVTQGLINVCHRKINKKMELKIAAVRADVRG